MHHSHSRMALLAMICFLGIAWNEAPTAPCPVPDLSVSTTAYSSEVIDLFFSTGFEEEPPYGCFTTGEELYLDSRIDLFIPGGDLVLSLPRDYISQPAPLEMGPIRPDRFTGRELTFGDAFGGDEFNPDLTMILKENPILDGHVKLCNRDGQCDEIDFTLKEFSSDKG